jgi:hypothetical protein
MIDLAKFAFDTAVAMNRAKALELGLPDPFPSAPKPVEYIEAPCGICAGWGHVHDGYRGSERNQMCRACAGKGTVIHEKARP